MFGLNHDKCRWGAIIGFGLTPVVIASLEAARLTDVNPPAPFLVLALAVAISASLSGLYAGIFAGLCASGFVLASAETGFAPDSLVGSAPSVIVGCTIYVLIGSLLGKLTQYRHHLIEERTAHSAILHREITEHTEALRRSEHRFRDFAESASDWLWETDSSHRFTFLSDRVSEVTGLPVAAHIGKTRLELAGTEKDHPKLIEHMKQLNLQTPFKDLVFQRVAPDGSPQFISVSGKPFFDDDGTFLGYRGIASNVTDRVQKDQEILESRQRFEDFAKTASDWFWEQDESHRFTYVSLGNEDKIGMNAECFLGLTRRESPGLEADPDRIDALEETMDRHESFRDFRYTRRLPDGQTRQINISGTPFFTSDGKFAGYRGTGTDVSALVMAERRILEQVGRLEQANRDKTAFLANVSHELRTPLNAILGFSDAVQMDVVPISVAKEYCGYIHDSGSRLLSFVNDLLDVSALETGKRAIELEWLSPDEVVRQCLDELALRIESKNLSVELKRHGTSDRQIHADHRALGQIMTNLVTNAVKFTPQGGKITIAIEEHEDKVCFRVSDTGPGISKQDQENLFEPYYQVTRNPHLASEGSGLGLSIVRALVAAHSGQVYVHSDLGEGASFVVCLPRDPKRPILT